MAGRFLAVLALTATAAFADDRGDILPRAEPVPGGIAIVALGRSESAPMASFTSQRVMVAPCPDGWCAIIGLALSIAAGEQVLTVDLGDEHRELRFLVRDKQYPVQRIILKDQRFVEPGPRELQRIAADQAAINRAFVTWSDNLPPLRFVLPANGPVSGNFGVQRYFNGQPRAPHSGLDIAAPEGAPIRAPAPGVVVETGNYFFNGNTVFVDHGQGLVTMYNHLRTILVRAGARLQTGDRIGEVGRTGRVTGAHLHWSVSLNNSRVDPLLLLAPEAADAPPGPPSHR